jgi:predicted acyltransferase
VTTATIVQPTKPQADKAAVPTQRLMSVDALRGFDMFWITGAAGIVYALERMTQTPITTFLATQLHHVEWEGLHFYDLIYPLFVFLMGVSMPFSLGRMIERDGRPRTLRRIVRRSILLFLIGIFYYGGLSDPWPNVRLLSVLSLFAASYLVGGILFCYFRPCTLAAIGVGILIGYWALLRFVPIRNIQLDKANFSRLAQAAGDPQTAALFRSSDKSERDDPFFTKNSTAMAAARRMFYATTTRVTGKFDEGLNLANHLDFEYLPGKKGGTFYDPEGYLPNIPAVVTCLLGIFAGLLLKNQTVPDLRKVAWLIGLGAVLAALGWLWGTQFPVVKKLWSSSYVLVTGGYSAMLLGVFYLIVDVWQIRAWCQPFVWMGMNSITIYVGTNVLGNWNRTASRFLGGDVKAFFDANVAKGFGDLVISVGGLVLAFWFVNFLYRKKIFLRL